MALKVGIVRSSEVSKWCTFETAAGQAEFKIRGIGYKPFQVALEKAGNQISSKGYDVMVKDENGKLYHELLLDAAGAHLIEDWKGVVFAEVVEGETIEIDQPYTPENASKLLNLGDIGLLIKSKPRRYRRMPIRIRRRFWESHRTLQVSKNLCVKNAARNRTNQVLRWAYPRSARIFLCSCFNS